MTTPRLSIDPVAPRTLHANQEPASAPLLHAQQSLQLGDYVAVLRRRRWLVLGLALIFSLAGVAYAFTQAPTYETKAVVLVRPTKVDLGRTSLRPDQLLNLLTEREVVLSEATAASVAAATGVEAEDLTENLSVIVVEGTQVMEIRYVDSDPQRAQVVTQAFAEAYLEQRAVAAEVDVARKVADIRTRRDAAEQELATINAKIGQSDPSSPAFATAQSRRDLLISEIQQLQIELANVLALSTDPGEVLTPARLPEDSDAPSPLMAVAVALGAGLLLGVPVAFLRDRLDDRVRGISDLEVRSGLPVLAALPKPARGFRSRRRRASVLDPSGPTAEGFRRLRVALSGILRTDQAVKLVVTSVSGGEDAGFVGAGMAVTLARGGIDVLLVSAEAKDSALHNFLGIANDPGLYEMALEGSTPSMTARWVSGVPRLKVITAGNTDGPIDESVRLGALEDLMMKPGDASVTIVVAPRLLESADVLGISGQADGVLISSRAGVSRVSSTREALHELEALQVAVLGGVLTNATTRRRRR